MGNGCLFCKIIDGSVPSKKVYENEWVLAFEDISPAARVHVLIVPKKHFADILAPDCGENSGGAGCGAGGGNGGMAGCAGGTGNAGGSYCGSVNACGAGGGVNTGGADNGDGDDSRYVLELHRAIKAVAEITGIAKSGFRVISNCGSDGGQTVPHLHYHILGGQPFGPALL